MTDNGHGIRRDAAIVFLVAAAMRVALALSLPVDDTVFWDQPYWHYARNFAEGRGFWMPNPYGEELGLDRVYAFRSPLFPFLWGCVYNLTGGAYAPIRCAHAILGAATCVLAYLAGRELLRHRSASLIGGLLCAVYPPLIWHSVHLMTEPLYIFLVALCMYALFRYGSGRRLRWLVVAGLAAGLGTLTRSVLIGFVPFMALWIWWVRGRRGRGLRDAGLLCGIVLAAMLPWIIRNALVLGAFVPTTTDAGHGVYVANNPNALHDPRGFWIPEDWSFLKQPGETAVGEVEASRRLVRRTLRYLASNPGAALMLMGRRFVTLWRFYPHREFVSLKHVIVYAMSYIPLFPFMLFGAWLAHRRAGERVAGVILIDLLVLYTTLIHVVSLAMMRYRVPLMPFLLLFAGLGLTGLGRAIVDRTSGQRT